ncbi:MAG TPA: choice-of-anchor tandem repeat GloVer-containing protein, partial [Chitinophagales bacterium]|nr:choice-of-anchor tandem repeat GloVer-containing protein [Chitinophagales bacterium]
NGYNANGSLMQATDGKLYGMTSLGGTNYKGVIFSFDLNTMIYTKLMDFDGNNGAYPQGSLIQATNGKLYGMTPYGGVNDYGVIFNFDITNNTYSKLFDNDITDGDRPQESLIQATDGQLYGMMGNGGYNSYGQIFSFDPVINNYTFLYSLSGCVSSLIQATDGKLYGMTSMGGGNNEGVIFSFDINTITYTALIDFDGANGASPRGSLVEATNGNLYGMTCVGGVNNGGVIFSFEITTGTCTKLFDFDNEYGYWNGGIPRGSLMLAADNKLYAMTSIGGKINSGVLFSFDLSTSDYSKLFDFNTTLNGSSPLGSLMQAYNDKLYGMTSLGGINNLGMVFSFDWNTNTYTNLHDFDNTDAAIPYGSLIQATNGKLYGMTVASGIGYYVVGYGAIFSIDTNTYTYSKLYDFDGNNGASPFGSLIQATDGKLYGMTYAGGINDLGVLFSFDPDSNILTKLFDFDGINGAHPHGSLMQAANGKLYGMTFMGTLFSFDITTGIYSKLYDCDYYTGGNPYGNLIQATNGKLYGMTSGYYNQSEALFSYDIPSGTVVTEVSFGPATGEYPHGSLFQASNGKLYGMTYSGGSYNAGVIFNFDPASSAFEKLRDLTVPDGIAPIYSNFIEIPSAAVGISENASEENEVSISPNPVADQLQINLNNNYPYILQIKNIFGVPMTKKISNSALLQIDVTDFPSGIYFLSITDEKKHVVTKKLIKI